MKRYGKLLLGFLLWAVMMLGYVCSARAATDTYTHLIPSKTDSDEELAGKQVTFNGYKWYIIEYRSQNAGTLTLFAVEPIDAARFYNNENSGNQYKGSVIEGRLNSFTLDGTFKDVAEAIDTTDLNDVGVTGARLYLLSDSEADSLPDGERIRKCGQAKGAESNHWWLRTPGYQGSYAKAIYGEDGGISLGNLVNCIGGVRPALKLNLSKVNYITVNLSGGKNATSYGGSSVQKHFFLKNSADAKMTDVSYNADTGYHFESFLEINKNGIKVKWNDERQVIVKGSPTDNVVIAIPDAVANTYPINLDNQGATTTGANQVTATYNEALPGIAGHLPAKAGSVFGGYFSEKNGGGTQYLKADGTPTNAKWTTAGTGTLYAKWTAMPPATITKKPTANKRIYDGKPAPLLNTDGEAEGGTLLYAVGQDKVTAPDTGWSRSIPERTEEGCYYVWVKAQGDSTHIDSRATCIPSRICFPVTFKVVHGEWDDGGSWDTVLLPSRYADEDLVLTLNETDIPKVGKKPRSGYKEGAWDEVPSTDRAISGARTYTYTYVKGDPVYYTVTFTDGLGNTLKTEKVESGRPATAPAAPKRDGHRFKGWDRDFAKVTGDMTVKALWEKNAAPAPEPEPAPGPSPSPDNDKEPAGASFKILQPRAAKLTEKSVRFQWKKVDKARKYVVYGNVCGRKNRMKKLAVVTGTSITIKNVAGKKVKKGTYYKFYVRALDQDNKVISCSPAIHAATKGGKVGNYKKVIITAKIGKKTKTVRKVSIKPGESIKLKAKPKAANRRRKVKEHVGVRFESGNPGIATVSRKGLVKGKAEGSCLIYAYAQNGVCKRVRITVK